MKKLINTRLLIISLLISLGLLAFGFVYLTQSVTALMYESNLMFFDFEFSGYFIFDLSKLLIIIAWVILALIVIFPILQKIIGGK